MPETTEIRNEKQGQLNIDFTTPEAIANPYPLYEKLQNEAPVHWDELQQAWIVTRYQDVKTLLNHPDCSSKFVRQYMLAELFPEHRDTLLELAELESKWLIMDDAPSHTRLRKNLQPAYTSSAILHMREKIQASTNTLLDQVELQGQMDVANDFSFPLAMAVIVAFLDIAAADQHRVKDWLAAILLMSPENFGQDPEKALADNMRMLREMKDYVTSLIEERRQRPGDDLISHCLHGQSDEDGLTDIELVANFQVQFLAGFTTTRDLITNGILHLLTHKTQLAELCENPALIPNAVHECLRYDNSVGFTARIATADIDIQGQTIPAGQRIMLAIGAANRDPRQFENPHEFNIRRTDTSHIAFGYGPHHCIGRQLALMELEIAFSTMLRRLPNLQLAVPVDQLEWEPNLTVRSLKSLPVSWSLDHHPQQSELAA